MEEQQRIDWKQNPKDPAEVILTVHSSEGDFSFRLKKELINLIVKNDLKTVYFQSI